MNNVVVGKTPMSKQGGGSVEQEDTANSLLNMSKLRRRVSTFSEAALNNAISFLQQRNTAGSTVSGATCSASRPTASIRRSLYQTSEFYSDYRHDEPSHGALVFSIYYNTSSSDLLVRVKDVVDLSSDVVSYFLEAVLEPPVDHQRRISPKFTRTFTKTAVPTDEDGDGPSESPPKPVEDPFVGCTFKFPMTFDETEERTLRISTYRSKRRSRAPVLLGETRFDLSSIEEAVELTVESAVHPTNKKTDLGEVQISLSYLPSVERLVLNLRNARRLKIMDMNGCADPYVKAVLCEGASGRRLRARTSAVRRNTLNPRWDAPLTFGVRQQALAHCALELYLLDYDLIGDDELIGYVCLCTDDKRQASVTDIKSESTNTTTTTDPPPSDGGAAPTSAPRGATGDECRRLWRQLVEHRETDYAWLKLMPLASAEGGGALPYNWVVDGLTNWWGTLVDFLHSIKESTEGEPAQAAATAR